MVIIDIIKGLSMNQGHILPLLYTLIIIVMNHNNIYFELTFSSKLYQDKLNKNFFFFWY